jgi:hypothetical protein
MYNISMSIALGISIVFILACLYTISKINNDKKILEKELAQTLIINPSENEVIKEDFLKFVSDSREWAYDYIEEVQKVILDFKTAVEKDIAYFDKFGIVGSAYPHYDSMQRITAAYKELMTILPKENDVTT